MSFSGNQEQENTRQSTSSSMLTLQTAAASSPSPVEPPSPGFLGENSSADGSYAQQLQTYYGLVSNFNDTQDVSLLSKIQKEVSNLLDKAEKLLMEDINLLTVLADVKDPTVLNTIFMRLFELSSGKAIAFNPAILLGFARIILLYSDRKGDGLPTKEYVTVLTLFQEQFNPRWITRDVDRDLTLCNLVSLNCFLDAMIWEGIAGIGKEVIKTPFLEKLEKIANKAKRKAGEAKDSREKRIYIEMYAQAQMAWQGLRRIDSDESKKELIFRKGVAFILGMKQFSLAAGAAAATPVTFGLSTLAVPASVYEGYQQMKIAFHRKGEEKQWYVDVQNFRNFLMNDIFMLQVQHEKGELKIARASNELRHLLDGIMPAQCKDEIAQLCAIDVLVDLLAAYPREENEFDAFVQAACCAVLGEYVGSISMSDSSKNPVLKATLPAIVAFVHDYAVLKSSECLEKFALHEPKKVGIIKQLLPCITQKEKISKKSPLSIGSSSTQTRKWRMLESDERGGHGNSQQQLAFQSSQLQKTDESASNIQYPPQPESIQASSFKDDFYSSDLLPEEQLIIAKGLSLEKVNESEAGSRGIGEYGTVGEAVDDGNCFYDAVFKQMSQEQQRSIGNYGKLRQRIDPGSTKEKWADTPQVRQFARQYRCVVAIIDTRHPRLGFHIYYVNERGIDSDSHNPEDVPSQRIFRLAYNGNHYMPVESHRGFARGAIQGTWSAPVLAVNPKNSPQNVTRAPLLLTTNPSPASVSSGLSPSPSPSPSPSSSLSSNQSWSPSLFSNSSSPAPVAPLSSYSQPSSCLQTPQTDEELFARFAALQQPSVSSQSGSGSLSNQTESSSNLGSNTTEQLSKEAREKLALADLALNKEGTFIGRAKKGMTIHNSENPKAPAGLAVDEMEGEIVVGTPGSGGSTPQ